MVQNRNKLLLLFIGNAANIVVHRMLEAAIGDEEVKTRYEKEAITSREIARKYREKINPKQLPLPERDAKYIQEKIKKKVETELRIRIKKGYTNINLGLVEKYIVDVLSELQVV